MAAPTVGQPSGDWTVGKDSEMIGENQKGAAKVQPSRQREQP